MKPPGESFDEERFRARPVIGILRGFDAEATLRIFEAARRGGLGSIEITMDTPGAAALIARAVADHGDVMNIGAGTVTTLERLEVAQAAGATFIVTPALLRAVVETARGRGLPVFPGACSPTEILAAWEMGATMVKVFPVDGLGMRYLRAVKDALPQVALLPTGGVDLRSLAGFRSAGADGFGVGSPLFHRERVLAGDWDWVEAQCRAWVEAVAAQSWRPEAEA